MQCRYSRICGGCRYREKTEKEYRELKIAKLQQTLKHLTTQDYKFNLPVFIADGHRRRAAFNFSFNKKILCLGFNEAATHNLVDITECLLLTPQINAILPNLRKLLFDLCIQTYNVKIGKKYITKNITQGSVWVCEADNGIDIVLEYDAPIDINARMIIAEFCQSVDSVIRLSHRDQKSNSTETLFQKITPCIKMGNYDVQIPAGTFLQATKDSERVLAELVVKQLKNIKGQIADLFCGVGTFSYYIASAINNIKILSIDSDTDLLRGFKDSLNNNQITNIEIKKQNLFKYPLIADEISQFDAIVFDPPRAGAKEQCKQIIAADKKPKIVVAISCNPNTFVNDANTLIVGGYNLTEITLVDQFNYSDHSELVAIFQL